MLHKRHAHTVGPKKDMIKIVNAIGYATVTIDPVSGSIICILCAPSVNLSVVVLEYVHGEMRNHFCIVTVE